MMAAAAENAGDFIAVLQKMLELYEEVGEREIPIRDVKLLLRHFELDLRNN